MNATLLPCPFCGGDPEMDTEQPYRNISNGEIETAVAVYCLGCSAEISICRGDVPDVEPAHVIELWNKRAAVEPTPITAIDPETGEVATWVPEWARINLHTGIDLARPGTDRTGCFTGKSLFQRSNEALTILRAEVEKRGQAGAMPTLRWDVDRQPEWAGARQVEAIVACLGSQVASAEDELICEQITRRLGPGWDRLEVFPRLRRYVVGEAPPTDQASEIWTLDGMALIELFPPKMENRQGTNGEFYVTVTVPYRVPAAADKLGGMEGKLC